MRYDTKPETENGAPEIPYNSLFGEFPVVVQADEKTYRFKRGEKIKEKRLSDYGLSVVFATPEFYICRNHGPERLLFEKSGNMLKLHLVYLK